MEFLSWLVDGSNILGENGIKTMILYVAAWYAIVYLSVGIAVRFRFIMILAWPLFVADQVHRLRYLATQPPFGRDYAGPRSGKSGFTGPIQRRY